MHNRLMTMIHWCQPSRREQQRGAQLEWNRWKPFREICFFLFRMIYFFTHFFNHLLDLLLLSPELDIEKEIIIIKYHHNLPPPKHFQRHTFDILSKCASIASWQDCRFWTAPSFSRILPSVWTFKYYQTLLLRLYLNKLTKLGRCDR